MRELQVNSVVITTGNSLQGIFTSKDVLMRVVAQNLSPELTLVEKVMTAHPDCATLDTSILDALHICMMEIFCIFLFLMEGGHLPVDFHGTLDPSNMFCPRLEGGPGTANDAANTIMQKFWDSALSLKPADEEFDSHSEISLVLPSEVGDGRSSIYPPVVGNSFAFKLQDQKGRMHRFTHLHVVGSERLDELVSSVMQRLGFGGKKGTVQLLYDDDEGDRVLLTTDADLAGAVIHAKSSGLKALRLHIDESGSNSEVTEQSLELTSSQRSQLTPLHYGLIAGAIVLTGVAVMVYLKLSKV